MEIDLIPYDAHVTISANRALVLAPHPDDEIFGCGGAIAAHVRHGIPVQVVILTDGAVGGDADVRERETLDAARCLGYGSPVFWRLPDRGLRYSECLVSRVLDTVRAGNVDLLYAPSPWEIHPDHRQACAIAMEVVNRCSWPMQLAFYEVGVPLRPNVLLDIGPYMDAKRDAMGCFASQHVSQDYARHMEALNVYRTYTLPAIVRAAEAFRIVTPVDLRTGNGACLTGFAALRTGAKPLASNYAAADWPLVSVLVRSMNRGELTRALDSVALQNYPNLEVVVVAACVGHPKLPEIWAGLRVRLIETDAPVPRSRAANRAMQNAAGDLLLFLDDDDWLLPDHIGRLVAALTKLPNHDAAYTGVALVDADGNPTGQAFDLPFDQVRLMAGNLMPIHAVMFRTRLLRQGLAFDESLDLYEDWDFWNRMTRLTVMAHLPGVSAVYQVHESSGVHNLSDLKEEQADEVMNRWLHTDPVTARQVRERVWRFSELEERTLNAENNLSQRIKLAEVMQVDLARAVADATAARIDLDRVLTSSSWRLTRPLRAARALAGSFWQRPSRLPGLVVKVAGVIRREGWQGVHHRLSGLNKRWPWHMTDYESWRASLSGGVKTQRVNWAWRPQFSVVMPVYNPPLDLLMEAVQSIQAQSYPEWELCMADDASPNPDVWAILESLAKNDSRIKVMRRSENGHISRTSNDALSMASGDFVVLMDNDDLLAPDALEAVAEVLQERPDAQMLYSDEDKLDASNRHFGPYLKPDWNRLLFMGHNLISHLGVFRTALIKDVGGFRVGLEGSQDYDLALRCLEHIDDDQVIHIPKVLYHWRAIEGSTALATTEKPYAVVAAQRALQEHRQHQGLSGQIEVTTDWNYRCQRLALRAKEKLAVLVVGQQEGKVPAWTLQKGFRVDEVRMCAADTRAVLAAIADIHADALLLVSPDLIPAAPSVLNDLVGVAMEPGFGAAAGTVYGHHGELLGGAWVLNATYGATVLMHGLPDGNPGYMGRASLDQEVSAAQLNCMVVRPAALKGLTDCDSLPWGWCVGLAWAWLMRQRGLKLAWCPSAKWRTGMPEYYRRHPDALEIEPLKKAWGNEWTQRLSKDPCYHPALDAEAADFSFR